MVSPPKPNPRAARDDQAAERELASAVRPVRLMLAASVILPLALFAFASWISFHQHLTDARDRVQRNLNTVYEHALKVFETFELSAQYLDELTSGLSDAEIRKEEIELNARLKSITDRLPQLRDLWVISASGEPLVSGTVYPMPKLNLSDRDYFRAQKNNAKAGTYVSEVLKARAADTSFFTLSRRRPDAKGEFGGVTIVSIAPEYFINFYSRLPPPGVFALIRDDGAILARFPDLSTRLERLAPDSTVMRSIADKPDEGFVSGTSTFNGITRIFAYRRMPNYNIYVVSGIESEVVIRDWLDTMASHLVFGIPTTLAMIGLGLVALRRTRREAAAYSQLRHEVARREQTELALHQAMKMEAVGRLTGGIAHDFNNLLTAILGNVDLALRRVGEDERLKRSLSSARQASERAASLVQRLLAFSRQHPQEVKAVDVNRLVQDMSELLRRTIGETITVETVLAGGLWKTAIDPNQLENAILNLAINARDAMKEGGRLTIETANTYLDESYVAANGPDLTPGQYVMLAISDTGSGMSKEVIERAFEPFFTTKPTGAGTGLGLSMVYGFVKQSGGHVKIYSEPGEGTSIKLYLPRLTDESKVEPWIPASHAENKKDDASEQPEKILLVEDDEEVNRFSSEILRDEGYQVISTHEGASGLRLLDANPDIQLLFTDVVLPGGMNGRQLADEARRRRPDLKVLFTTGYTRNAIIHQGRLDADVDLLTKPFTSEALARKVRQILDMEAKDPVTRVNAILDNIQDKPQDGD
jgi:two-component system NtrC family sensor kinase